MDRSRKRAIVRTNSFSEYELSDELLKAIELLNYKAPTKVQQEVIPTLIQKKDVIVKSQTGSGKTASFSVPICELIDWLENKPQALVIVPTRELAVQVKEDIFHIGRFKRIKASAIFGRAPFANQELELKQKTHVVVGTPGRIIDHLERHTLDVSMVKYLVIDEADEMLRMGFIEQVTRIIDNLPKERVTALFSATIPDDIENLCSQYMNEPKIVAIEEQSLTVDRIEQEKIYVQESDKIALLKDITVETNPDSCIIFCNMKQTVDEVTDKLKAANYSCDKIHGGMEQRDRLKVMEQFRLGKFRYLVATDVAARGIDIDHISLVINYDISKEKENYVHRIGRTGRINREGKAISFISPRENRLFDDIEEYIGKEIPLKEAPSKDLVQENLINFKDKNNKITKLKEIKGSSLNKGIVKIYINAGKKGKIRPVDIVGTICSIEGITADDIGIIQIADIFTTVEILNGKGKLVLKELQNRPIKGKLRKVRVSDRARQ